MTLNNFLISNKVKRLIPYLLGIILIIFIIKPLVLFKPNGQVRSFGIGLDTNGHKKTLYSLEFILIILILFIYEFEF